MRLKLFAEGVDSLRRHRTFEAGGQALTLLSVRAGPHGAIARFAEVATRDVAEALRGRELSVAREALPPLEDGEVYVADLIGLPALADGVWIGRVARVENYGAGALIEIDRDGAAAVLIPFTRCELSADGLTVDPVFLADG